MHCFTAFLRVGAEISARRAARDVCKAVLLWMVRIFAYKALNPGCTFKWVLPENSCMSFKAHACSRTCLEVPKPSAYSLPHRL